jgi:hypothetical protein
MVARPSGLHAGRLSKGLAPALGGERSAMGMLPLLLEGMMMAVDSGREGSSPAFACWLPPLLEGKREVRGNRAER